MFQPAQARHQGAVAAAAPRNTPILLTMPNYGGTLAAARCLGRQRIPLTMAGEGLLSPARWSRYTTRWVQCPPVDHTEEFLDWLLGFGQRNPGHVLYAPSDDLAWLFSSYADQLGQYFRMYQPPVETLVRVLDKRSLYAACDAVGIPTPPTWFPESEADLSRVAREAVFPLLIKPRTQVLRARQDKGVVVHSAAELNESYRAFMARDRYLPGVKGSFGDVTRPMVQQFLSRASQAVYSVTGFIDRSASLFAARAAIKVLQRTQPVGLGVAFEAAPLEPQLARAVARLCRATGHFGVFEVEFLREEGRALAIDFNPRFYGQMGFEAQRGLPLPLWVWLGACGAEDELAGSVLAADRAPDGPATAYCHRAVFEMLLAARRLTGRMSHQEWRGWRRWHAQHRATSVDASADSEDRLPGWVHTLSEFWAGVRAVPRMLKQRN